MSGDTYTHTHIHTHIHTHTTTTITLGTQVSRPKIIRMRSNSLVRELLRMRTSNFDLKSKGQRSQYFLCACAVLMQAKINY